MNVVLIGMPGAGKSRLGREVARRTGMKFFDTDSMIREKYGPIPEIFRKYGEEKFREIEAREVARAAKADDAIVSTGGGTLMREKNALALARNGKFVYLKASPEVLSVRAFYTKRPLLEDAGSLFEMYAKRTPVYEKYADAVVDADTGDVDAKVDELEKIINGFRLYDRT